MNAQGSSERLIKAMAYARRRWQNQRKQQMASEQVSSACSQPFTVAITRESGSNGGMVAQALGLRLDWPVYDKELIQRIADEMGLHAELLESVDERQGSWLQESLEALGSKPIVSGSGFARRLVETLLALGAHGECVILGRGAAQIMPLETTLRVRLVAPLAARVANKSGTLGISPDEARRRVETIDRQRREFVKSHFHKDPADATLYDLTLNSSRFSIDECAELIAEALHRLQKHAATGKTSTSASRLATASR